jgi:hypothetical protein
MENKSLEEKDELWRSVESASPKKMVEFIGVLEQEQEHDFSDVANIMKRVTFLKFLNVLDVPSHTFRCTQKRYKTYLHINAAINDISLWISKKDSQNLDDMYLRLYDMHRDELLDLVEKHDSKLRASEEVAI